MSKYRVLIVFGTRPEAIKMAPVCLELNRRHNIEPIVCVTAQHREMLDDVLAVFGIQPDYDLNIMRRGQSLAEVTSAVLSGLSEIIQLVNPARVVVHGDTNTTLAAGLAAFYLKVPVGHVEAGLRTGDLSAPWPEELNRRTVDLFADLLWAPTNAAAMNLRREKVRHEDVFVTGNTVIDALRIIIERLNSSPILSKKIELGLPHIPSDRRILLVTGHRRESFGRGLQEICQALGRLALRNDVEIVWPVHPNPMVADIVKRELSWAENIHLIEPLDYVSFVALMRQAYLIVTDSGGIQEEAPYLGKPVLITRGTTERPEAIAAGAARLVGCERTDLYDAATELLDDPTAYAQMVKGDNPFGDGFAAQRIADSIEYRHVYTSLM